MSMFLRSCALISLLVASGCAFKQVKFDNNTTYEDSKRGVRMSERDVRVSAKFNTYDAVVNQVQQKIGMTFDGTAAAMNIQDRIEENTAKEANVEEDLERLIKLVGNEETLNSVPNNVIRSLSNPAQFNTQPGKGEAGALAFQSGFTAKIDACKKTYMDLGLNEVADAIQKVCDDVLKSDEWKALRNEVMKNASSENLTQYSGFSYCVSSAAIAYLDNDVIMAKVNAKRKELAESRKDIAATIDSLNEKLIKLIPKGKDREDLVTAMKEARKNVASQQSVAGTPTGAQGLAVNLAKEKLDEKKKELTEAKDAEKSIQELSMPSGAKNAALNAQKKYIQDLQGEYYEAANEFLAVVSEVSAVTNYEGPGEVGKITTMSFFGASDTIQRYPNGMVKSVGPNQYRKGLAVTVTEEMFKTLRVLGIPAAYVAGIYALSDLTDNNKKTERTTVIR